MRSHPAAEKRLLVYLATLGVPANALFTISGVSLEAIWGCFVGEMPGTILPARNLPGWCVIMSGMKPTVIP
jgi:hypothetical protein